MISSRLVQLFQNPMAILYTLPGIIIGLTVHEWAHAFVAYKLGDPTAKEMGRLTLNPLAHIDPYGFLSLLLLGFGWAKPVPVNPRNFKNYKRDDILVSVAGVVMNLIVAFIMTIVFYLGVYKWNMISNTAFQSIVMSIITINLSLAVFNLIPIYPLDGSHILDGLLMHKAPKVCIFLHKYGQIILIALLIFGVVSSVLSAVVNWIWRGFSNAVLFLIRPLL